jgi:methionyl-tRNA formyltransferase
MNKIKIGYFADGPWSHLAFEKIIKDPEIDVKFIVPRNDTKDETLKNYSIKYNIDYLFPVKINSSEFIKEIKNYDCDLFVSLSFNQIFKSEIIGIPKIGIINCHAGKLPFYRGRNILNWVLINDESEFGITVHFVDQGIDTGDIISQKVYSIDDNDNYGTLLNRAFKECANLLFETLQSFKNNSYQRIPQSEIHPVGFYCGGRGVGDEIIDWNQTTREIFNFIRSISYPGPLAQTYLNSKVIKLESSMIIEGAPCYKGIPGQVLMKTNKGLIVKTLDSFIEIFVKDSDIRIMVGDKFKQE